MKNIAAVVVARHRAPACARRCGGNWCGWPGRSRDRTSPAAGRFPDARGAGGTARPSRAPACGTHAPTSGGIGLSRSPFAASASRAIAASIARRGGRQAALGIGPAHHRADDRRDQRARRRRRASIRPPVVATSARMNTIAPAHIANATARLLSEKPSIVARATSPANRRRVRPIQSVDLSPRKVKKLRSVAAAAARCRARPPRRGADARRAPPRSRSAWRDAASQSPTAARIAPRACGRSLSGARRLAGDEQQHAGRRARSRRSSAWSSRRMRRRQRVAVQVDRAIGRRPARATAAGPSRRRACVAAARLLAAPTARRPGAAVAGIGVARRTVGRWRGRRRTAGRHRGARPAQRPHARHHPRPQRGLVRAEASRPPLAAPCNRASVPTRQQQERGAARRHAARGRLAPRRPRPRRCRSGWRP